MDIDELLKRHPAPLDYKEIDRMEYNGCVRQYWQVTDANGDDVCVLNSSWFAEVLVSAVNAYAALKAEVADLRGLVVAYDRARSAMIEVGGEFHLREDYVDGCDTARAKVKP